MEFLQQWTIGEGGRRRQLDLWLSGGATEVARDQLKDCTEQSQIVADKLTLEFWSVSPAQRERRNPGRGEFAEAMTLT